MGFLNVIAKPTLNLVRLPSGSFTVDARGGILVSTLPRSFPKSWAEEIAKQVLAAFQQAQAADLSLHELVADYSSLRLTARTLRGGAIIFLSPHGLGRK
jgi:hypothetical protein